MVDLQKGNSHISRRDHHQQASPLSISNLLRQEFILDCWNSSLVLPLHQGTQLHYRFSVSLDSQCTSFLTSIEQNLNLNQGSYRLYRADNVMSLEADTPFIQVFRSNNRFQLQATAIYWEMVKELLDIRNMLKH